MKRLENLLRQTIGLHTPAVGPATLEHAVHARMAALGISKDEDFFKRVCASNDEWDALVELVVVTETWFFRDREPFHAFVNLVRNEWLPANPKKRLRILSLPCSTGEEPYSIAMSLLDAGIPATRFQIDALDICANAIAKAQRAEYGKNSFRGGDLDFRGRYFQQTAKGHWLNATVRKLVHFETGNLLDDYCLRQSGAYDFIFCRNLLIYFDRPAQQRALRKLNRLLLSQGVLFVGSAEVPIATKNGFVSAHLPLGFACRKSPTEGSLPRPLRPVYVSGEKQPDWIPAPSKAFPFQNSALTDQTPLAGLARARQLANAGRLAEAAEICEKHLREHGASAEAYYLLGLVRDAAGAETLAGELYRKALYLEPNHYETLLHWASLSKKSGNNSHARILAQRAGRIPPPDAETS